MSLWLSERKTAGLWAGGLWRSQQGSPYAFNLDLTTFKDTVTGRSLSCNIDGTRYDEVGGVTTAFGTDVPTIADNGLRICGAYSNLLRYSANLSDAVWDKSNIIVSNNQLMANDKNIVHYLYQYVNINNICTFTVEMQKESSNMTYLRVQEASTFSYFYNLDTLQIITESGGAVPLIKNSTDDYKKCIIKILSTITGNYTFRIALVENNALNRVFVGNNVTVYNTVRKTQLSTTKYTFPYIPTTTDAVSSPSEAGNSGTGTGIWIDDVASNFPLLNTALTSQGTLTFKWKPGFNDADVSGNLNILSFDGTTDSAISYDADNNLIKLTDGTNTASKALTVVADTEYTIQATWGLVSGSPKMQIAVNGTAGTQADFTGTFTPSDIYFGLENEELQYIKDFIVYKEATWL